MEQKDRFFVTLGRLMHMAGKEYDSVKSEYGEEWKFLTEKQRFDILDKHVLEITADVIYNLPEFLNELKLSAEQLKQRLSKTPQQNSASTAFEVVAKKDSSAGVKKGVSSEPTSRKGNSPDSKKKAEASPKKVMKKSTGESTARNNSSETSKEKENSDPDISVQLNLHHLKKLIPTRLKILLKNMKDDKLSDLDLLEAIIDNGNDEKQVQGAVENNADDEALDPEIERLFANMSAASGDLTGAAEATADARKVNTDAPAKTGETNILDDDDLDEVFRTASDKTPYYPTQPYFGRPFVVDNGSETIRAGFGDEASPRVSIVNAVEIPTQHAGTEGAMKEAGEGCKWAKKLQYTMENGVVKDWDDMQDMWTHIFKSLYINPAEHPVLISDVAINPPENRKKITEIMFEEYNVPAFCIQNQSVLSMYGSATPTGIAVDIGESVATVMPVYEYNPVSHALQTSKIAGSYLNGQLIRAMKRHYMDDKHIITQPGLAREIKEKYCYIASDFDEEMKESTKSPGIHKAVCNPGLEVFLSDEVFTVPEALFKPKVLGEDNCLGIHELIQTCIRNTDIQLRSDLCDNVVISGGTTLMPGFVERLKIELGKVNPALNLVTPNDRKELVWRGGTVLSSMPRFQNGLITAQDYIEFGSNIVKKKCS